MIIYTDGSCSKNPDGVGAWAYVVWDAKKNKPLTSRIGRDYVTTSNRMELTAILEALKDFPSAECIISDSQYSINCISGKWQAKKNLDLILPAKTYLARREILSWVRGHEGIPGNEEADRLCNEEMCAAYLERHGVKFVPFIFDRKPKRRSNVNVSKSF
jgi:ribonuclease HI